MHTRQFGAAHINIFYFLIILVMFFGALFFGYLQLTRNTDLESRNLALSEGNDRTDKDNLLLQHYTEDIGEAIGILGSYEGRQARAGDYRIGDPPNPVYEAGPLENVADIEQIRDQLRTFASRVGVPEAQNLPEFLNRIGNTFDALNQRVANAQSQFQQLQSERDTLVSTNQQTVRDLTQQLRDTEQQVAQTRQELEAVIARQDADILALGDNINDFRDQLSTEREERDVQVRQLNERINRIQAQNDALTQKYSLINPPQAPDGRVIDANARLGVAFIDLGRKDMLQPGTVFQVLDPDRPGVVKAIGTVTRVMDEQSEMAISDVADPFRPVGNGDLISNEIYSPEIRRNIYLMGRFGYPYTKAGVQALLERLGNTVVGEIRPGVDLVVVGNELIDEETGTMIPLDETPEYRQVLDLSIEIVPLNRLHDLLKFDDR